MLIAPHLNHDLIKTGNTGYTRDYTEVIEALNSIQVKSLIKDLIKKLLCKGVCLYVFMCIVCVQCLQRSEEGAGFHGTTITGGASHHVCARN